ncbi:hypothetical protein DYU05_14480 [Mucilaginibacter terrenus]|uniref:Lipocalin-like domain-containing protein n=1 Tax=Mucilaginibacter terrenus TaxID=2482727 RepID=A0A3E2NQR6_9SPHI|nr:hypothetical protein [Mucilaginibacter terrenus]RFZ83338.1 hypothetical protein DYU05_14480 [Mucilaginibacter terrenus]
MKKLLLLFSFVFAASAASFAQCDKPVTFHSSTTNYLNDKGEIEKSKDEETVIKLSKTEVSIAPGDHTMTGAVTDYVCNWTVPFKEGKTTFKSLLADNDREMHATIIIEGKGGKVTLTFTVDEMPGKKIQVTADKFE